MGDRRQAPAISPLASGGPPQPCLGHRRTDGDRPQSVHEAVEVQQEQDEVDRDCHPAIVTPRLGTCPDPTSRSNE